MQWLTGNFPQQGVRIFATVPNDYKSRPDDGSFSTQKKLEFDLNSEVGLLHVICKFGWYGVCDLSQQIAQ
jgi:hypothetical protein